MFLLVTLVGVTLGSACARLVGRRLPLADPRRWLLLVPVPAVALHLGLRNGTTTAELLPQAVQAFALASVVTALVDVLVAVRRRRAPADRRGRVDVPR